VVKGIQYSIGSYMDLAFLIPELFKDGDPPPDKFLIFFDSTCQTEKAVHYLCTQLPPHLCDKIKWFHSTMSNIYHKDEYKALRAGDIWGLCVTDAFGMVSMIDICNTDDHG
jgi:hypothetical protein